jgi:hypothetical protein
MILQNSETKTLFGKLCFDFVKMKNFDYKLLKSQNISIIPPDFIISQWQQDYETMRETMIYGNSLSFNELIDKIKQLNERINSIVW